MAGSSLPQLVAGGVCAEEGVVGSSERQTLRSIVRPLGRSTLGNHVIAAPVAGSSCHNSSPVAPTQKRADTYGDCDADGDRDRRTRLRQLLPGGRVLLDHVAHLTSR